MTERLADVSARLAGMRKLDAIMNAMAGIAAARAHRARRHIAAVDAYAGNIAAAMRRIVALMPTIPVESQEPAATRMALVLFCAEQGFAGAFSERVLDALAGDVSNCDLFLVGSRGAAIAAERGIQAIWTSAMPSHSPGLPKLADRIVDAVFSRIPTGDIGGLDVVFSRWQAGAVTIERRRLFPVDLSAFAQSARAEAPCLNLPVEPLLTAISADYVHALVCNAALHAFAAENEARMMAMAAARNQIERELSELQATERRVRQEAITAEIIELAAGEAASRDGRR